MRPLTLITLILLLFAPAAATHSSTTFLTDGRIVSHTVVDINKMRVDFEGDYQVKTQDVWLINFHNANWNFPNERKQLRAGTCTIILTNGKVIYQNVTDYDARRSGRIHMENNTYIHVSAVKRIYFPHAGIPHYYAKLIKEQQDAQQSLKCTVYPRKGNSFTADLQHYDTIRKAFTFSNRYVSVITNIRMMRFDKDKPIHYKKRYKIVATVETVILKNGEVLTGTFVNFDNENKVFEFEEFTPIPVSEITKIYFRASFPGTKRLRVR
jgi:hypothetical protein